MSWSIELDFAIEVDEVREAGQTEQEAVAAWVREFAPGCDAEIVGRANGWPVVRLSHPDREGLLAAVRVYAGDDEQSAADAMEYAKEDGQ